MKYNLAVRRVGILSVGEVEIPEGAIILTAAVKSGVGLPGKFKDTYSGKAWSEEVVSIYYLDEVVVENSPVICDKAVLPKKRKRKKKA